MLVSSMLLLASVATPALGAIAPRASGTPSCTYKCPTADKSKWQLVGSRDLPPNTIVCYYYPTDQYDERYSCEYNSNTGVLTKDKDASFCLSQAIKDQCTPAKRDPTGIYEAYQAQRERRAAAPAPSVPEYMNAHAALKKRKMTTRAW